MWNKRIVVTKHAISRFEQRNIKFSTKNFNPVNQILIDLRPLNVRSREHLEGNNYKVTTNQGKVYIVVENRDASIVKTVYKTDLRFQNEYRKADTFEKRNKGNNQRARRDVR